jgi:hypothetical protein
MHMTDAELGELARMLQRLTWFSRLSDMDTRAALELMQQRGYTITKKVANDDSSPPTT